MNSSRPIHPCFQYCEIAPEIGRCNGCGHRFDEVLTWRQLSQERRDEAEREAREYLSVRRETREDNP